MYFPMANRIRLGKTGILWSLVNGIVTKWDRKIVAELGGRYRQIMLGKRTAVAISRSLLQTDKENGIDNLLF